MVKLSIKLSNKKYNPNWLSREPPTAITPAVANPPVVDAPPANNDNDGGNL